MSLAERIRTLKEAAVQQEVQKCELWELEKAEHNRRIKGRLDPVLSKLREIGLEELLQEIKTQQPDMDYNFSVDLPDNLSYQNYNKLQEKFRRWWRYRFINQSVRKVDKESTAKSLKELSDFNFTVDAFDRRNGAVKTWPGEGIRCSVVWNYGSNREGWDEEYKYFEIAIRPSGVTVEASRYTKFQLGKINNTDMQNALFEAFMHPKQFPGK